MLFDVNGISICIGTLKHCLRLNRLAAGAFVVVVVVVEKRHAFFQTCPCLTETCVLTGVSCFYIFLKTPNRRGTQWNSKWRLNFVLSCHIDPIGDRNDVQYLSISVDILFIFSISGSVPTFPIAICQ